MRRPTRYDGNRALLRLARLQEGCEKLNRYPMPPIQSRSQVPEQDSSGVAPPAALAEAQSGDAEEHPDVRLVNLAKAGDVLAFETLVKQYDRQVFRIAQHITQNREDAEDVVQDAFLKAYEKLNQFQGNSKFYTWLVRIAVNESLMRLRKRRTGKMVSIDEDITTEEGSMPRELADWGPSPEQQYGQSELAEILKKTVNGLPPGFRVVFVLRDVEGLSTEETAETLGLSIPAVKSRLLRARLQLRERLNRYFGRKNGDGGAK
jgi:RNA polymerase sigma-70 factor (ECF subfamily)